MFQSHANSHSRVMIIEVMGRNCGYLTLSSGLATEASYVFIPESPHKSTDEWKQKLINRINFERSNGQYFHIILVAEGASDQDGVPIRSESIKEYLNKDCDLESRIVVLGHLQRGGQTSIFDHLMSLQMGVEAYEILCKESDLNITLTINNGVIQRKSLPSSIEEKNNLIKFIREKKWSQAIEHRGSNFHVTWHNFRILMSEPVANFCPTNQSSWAIVFCCRIPMCGMNAILYALTRYGHSQTIPVLGFRNGFEGLIENSFIQLQWQQVSGLTGQSGIILGCESSHRNCSQISDESITIIVDNLRTNRIKSLCFVGDRQAFQVLKNLYTNRKRYDYLARLKYGYIPMSICDQNLIVSSKQFDEKMSDRNEKKITASKNSIQIEWSKLGRDSMLNKTMRLICDLIHSINGSHNQLYLIRLNLNMMTTAFAEPSLFSLAVGATAIYPFEKTYLDCCLELNDENIERDAQQIRDRILQTNENKFILM